MARNHNGVKGVFSKIFSKNTIGWVLGNFTAIDFSIVGAISFAAFLPVLLPFLGLQYTLNAAIGIGIASGISGFAVERQIYVGDIKSVFNLLFKDGFSWTKITNNIRAALNRSLVKNDVLEIFSDKKKAKNSKIHKKFNLTKGELLNLEKEAFAQVMGKMFRKTFNYKANDGKAKDDLHAWYRYQLKDVIIANRPKSTKRKKNRIYEDEWRQIFKNFCIDHPTKADAFITCALQDRKINKMLRYQLTEMLIANAEAKMKKDSTLTLERALLKTPKDHTKKFKGYSFLLIWVAPIVSLLAAVSFGAYSYTIFLSAFMYLGAAGLAAVCPAALIGILIVVPCAMWWYQSLSNAITSDLHIKIKNSFTNIMHPKGYENYGPWQKIAHGVAVVIGSIVLATIFTLSVILSFCAAGVYLQQNLEAAVTLGIKITQVGLWINRVIFAPSILLANVIFALDHLIEFCKKLKVMGKNLILDLKDTDWEKVGNAALEKVTTLSGWLQILSLAVGLILFTVVLVAMTLHFACEAAMTVLGQGSREELINRFVGRLVGLFNACFGGNLPSDLAKFIFKFFDEFFDDIDFMVEDELHELEHADHNPDQPHDHDHSHGHDHGLPSYGDICNFLQTGAAKIYNPEKNIIPAAGAIEGKEEVSYQPIFFKDRDLPQLKDTEKVYFQHTSDCMLTPIAALVA